MLSCQRARWVNTALSACNVYKFGRLLSKSSSPLDQKRFQTNFSPKLSNVKKRTLDSTIYAVSTAPLKAAISIVRLSGPGCLQIYKVLTRSQASPVPNRAVPKRLYSPNTGDILDNALVLFFQGPRSYTGEDVLELHLHGGRAVTNAILSTLKEMDVQESPLRYAEPGEFTKRSFYNGRLDLTEIEGIRDVIEAETEYQRRAAISAAEGHNRALYERWREAILRQAAFLTALIDFADDNAEIESSAAELMESVTSQVRQLTAEIHDHLVAAQRGELLREGIRVSFLGPPNVGKSSLLNALVQRDAAIVSDVPGTTRDILEVGIDLKGYKIVFGDTAGLRSIATLEAEGAHAADRIEAEGIRRALANVSASDMVIVVLSPDEAPTSSHLVAEQVSYLQQSGKRVVVALNKIDILDRPVDTTVGQISQNLKIPVEDIVPISCRLGGGIETLVDAIAASCKNMTLCTHKDPVSVSHRIQTLLQSDVIPSLDNAILFLQQDDVVLASAELHSAVEAIGKITGRGIGVEEILGAVFSSFCVGK